MKKLLKEQNDTLKSGIVFVTFELERDSDEIL